MTLTGRVVGSRVIKDKEEFLMAWTPAGLYEYATVHWINMGPYRMPSQWQQTSCTTLVRKVSELPAAG